MPTDEIIETMARTIAQHADVFLCGGDSVKFPAAPSTAAWADYSPREQAAARLAVRAALADAKAAGMVMVPTDQNATAARFARLLSIVRRLRWLDADTLALSSDSTKSALDDLAEFLFADGLDSAIAEARP